MEQKFDSALAATPCSFSSIFETKKIKEGISDRYFNPYARRNVTSRTRKDLLLGRRMFHIVHYTLYILFKKYIYLKKTLSL